MCSRKKQPKNFSSQNFMKSGTPMFLNVPNAMETSVFDGLNFLFLAAYVQPSTVCTRKPQLGQFLNRILGALCTRATHVQPKMHPVSLIFRESHRLAASLQPIGCTVVTTKPTPDTVHSPTPGQLHVESIQLACTCALCCCYALCMKREELLIFYSFWLRCFVVMMQYVGFLGRSQLFGSQVKVGAPTWQLARQLGSWRANLAVGARQLKRWRANCQVGAPTWRANS